MKDERIAMAAHIGEESQIIGHMLEHVAADQEVEAVVGVEQALLAKVEAGPRPALGHRRRLGRDFIARALRVPAHPADQGIENAAGKAWTLHADPKEVTARGGKGHQLQKKTTFTRPPVPVTIPSLGSAEGK